jgi:hypothetical protein
MSSAAHDLRGIHSVDCKPIVSAEVAPAPADVAAGVSFGSARSREHAIRVSGWALSEIV